MAPGSSKSEHLTAIAESAIDRATTSSLFFSASSMSIVEQIEHSKSHWSQVAEFDSDEDEVAEISNVDVFKTLQLHPTWGTFFKTFGDSEEDVGELVMGKKFAEGGQAELYEAQVNWRERILRAHVGEYGTEYVLKVFKKGTFLRHLRSQWPQGMLQFYAEKVETRNSGTSKYGPRYFCDVVCATLLGDGRFAFLMVREKADLRSVIDNIMLHKVDQNCGPFPQGVTKRIMYEVAKGMESLHGRNIIHRDLKASNVLVSKNFNYIVADYECSVGVVGTGFFRAPEILQACQNGNVSHKLGLFTKEADVYSYGMTCYEILTGKLPFEDHSKSDYDHILKGERPEVPEYIEDWAHELLAKCWHFNPSRRPSFDNILKILDFIEGKQHEEEECILHQVIKRGVRRKRWGWLRWSACFEPITRQISKVRFQGVHHVTFPGPDSDIDKFGYGSL